MLSRLLLLLLSLPLLLLLPLPLLLLLPLPRLRRLRVAIRYGAVVARISNFSKVHKEAPEAAAAACGVLAMLASDLANVNEILITGGAQGLAMAARSGSSEAVKARCAAALEGLAPCAADLDPTTSGSS